MLVLNCESDGYAVWESFFHRVEVYIQQVPEHAAGSP
jgi:hypothetical protein